MHTKNGDAAVTITTKNKVGVHLSRYSLTKGFNLHCVHPKNSVCRTNRFLQGPPQERCLSIHPLDPTGAYKNRCKSLSLSHSSRPTKAAEEREHGVSCQETAIAGRGRAENSHQKEACSFRQGSGEGLSNSHRTSCSEEGRGRQEGDQRVWIEAM